MSKTMFWSTAQQNRKRPNLRHKNIYTFQYQTLPFSSELQEYHLKIEIQNKGKPRTKQYKVNTL